MDKNPNITSVKKVLPVASLFFIVSAIGIFNHELWLDEAQHFLIARDSDSLKSVYYNMQYDGHVRLWNFLLFFITHYISSSPVAMQAFHLLIINATVFIFLRSAPFDMITKTLIIFGYFFLYEYDVISRNYTLGILFLFACCALLGDLEKNILWIGALLILMCNTHLFYVFTAGSIFLYIFLKKFQSKNIDKRLLIFSSLFLIGIFSVIIQIKIPPDNTYFHPDQTEWNSVNNIFAAFYGFAKGFLPIPSANHGDFWNHFLFDGLPVLVKLLIGIFLFIFSISLFYKNKPVLIFYLSSVLMLMFFLYISQMRASRYFGIFFIFFLSAAWLDAYDRNNIFSVSFFKEKILEQKLSFAIIYFILVCHIFSGIYAWLTDVQRPFTEAKNVAAFIRSTRFADSTIVMDGYGAGPALSAYLGKKVFYLNIDQLGSYCIWKKSYFEVPSKPLAVQLNASTYIARQNNFLLVSARIEDSTEIHTSKYSFHLLQLASFTNSIIKPNYYVYEVTMNELK
ncbi:MAG TPA: hypothetical protein VK787_06230 [Puia sp.]|nr:hypothetical protein [Puia sp.]